MAETVTSELPSLWRSMNEPRPEPIRAAGYARLSATRQRRPIAHLRLNRRAGAQRGRPLGKEDEDSAAIGEAVVAFDDAESLERAVSELQSNDINRFNFSFLAHASPKDCPPEGA